MDFDNVERFDLEQGSGWDSGGALLVATENGGDWVRSETFDALLSAYREMKQSLIDTLEE